MPVPALLLDANLSPRTARYLARTLGLDVVSVLERSRAPLKDPEVVALARREGRVIVTFDEDFTKRYGHVPEALPGVIYLRLTREFQFLPEVNRILERFFRTQAPNIDFALSIVTITEHTVSIMHR